MSQFLLATLDVWTFFTEYGNISHRHTKAELIISKRDLRFSRRQIWRTVTPRTLVQIYRASEEHVAYSFRELGTKLEQDPYQESNGTAQQTRLPVSQHTSLSIVTFGLPHCTVMPFITAQQYVSRGHDDTGEYTHTHTHTHTEWAFHKKRAHKKQSCPWASFGIS